MLHFADGSAHLVFGRAHRIAHHTAIPSPDAGTHHRSSSVL